jgi:hypothetical protein
MNLATTWMQSQKRRYKNRPWTRSTPPEADRPAAQVFLSSSAWQILKYATTVSNPLAILLIWCLHVHHKKGLSWSEKHNA